MAYVFLRGVEEGAERVGAVAGEREDGLLADRRCPERPPPHGPRPLGLGADGPDRRPHPPEVVGAEHQGDPVEAEVEVAAARAPPDGTARGLGEEGAGEGGRHGQHPYLDSI